MCDFHRRLITAAQDFGLEGARIVHGGSRGSARRHRHHPYIVGIIAGRPFEHPIKGRPKDRSRDYFYTYVRGIRHAIALLLNQSNTQ